MMQPILLYAFAAAVLGGLESPAGSVVGGLALGVFLNLRRAVRRLRRPRSCGCRSHSPCCSRVLLLKPHGLFGRKEVRRV